MTGDSAPHAAHAVAPVLAGRVALVTGAAQGLGAAIAAALAQAGAWVALLDHSAKVHDTARQLESQGPRALGLQADVSDEASVGAAFGQALAQLGPLDIWINNAAITPATGLWDIDLAEWDRVMAVNLRGCFIGCRLAGAHLRARAQQTPDQRLRQARIINLASLAGQQASRATGAHYAASKAGILALTRSFAQELAPWGICVNALAPAAIESPALMALEEGPQTLLRASIPLGCFGQLADVASAAVYLASDAGAFITGTTLDINGGRFMR